MFGGLMLAGDSVPVEAQEYSAYSDPEKPVISFLLADDANVDGFQNEFGLGDEEIDSVLAVVREENDTLATEYGRSEKAIGAGKKSTAVSEYNDDVRAAVATTKSDIEALLPEERRSDLRAWVDARWQQEREEFRASADDATFEASARGFRCKGIYASWYGSNTRNGNNYEVALPHRRLKFKGGFRVRINHNGHAARAPVKEVGPWNTRDNYWQPRKKRDMWRKLPRCKPEAEAAYFNDYNRGRDEQGRIVRNPAGIDLTLAVAKRMGIRSKLKQKGIIRVNVRYPWVKR
ncbi:MAG TPA: hypothetical protein VK869_06725 [Rubrobacteraceae bacterium]|nr:hypothetical protein [Rubrobacteraceae bacterium]